MKNFVFISPNFPTNYWQFCHHLKANGFHVLGVGDQPYDDLRLELKNSLTEYYKVDSLENYDAVYRAIAFFIHKYGRIDWLESNNEYWLERDARLRTDFNIPSGFQITDIPRIKFKSKMKEFYQKAGIPVARYYLVESYDGCLEFIQNVGYPVVAKPDNGVGASDTYKISNDKELKAFYDNKHPGVLYIMEEFIDAEVNSYDAIINSEGTPIFETGNVTPVSLMDVVNNDDNCKYYIVKDLPDDIRAAGRATANAFGVKSRFIHFEFFRLLSDQAIGKKGDVVALEVNMRPSGGITPDMINFAHSTDVYKIWADMITYDKSTLPEGTDAYCAYVGRRDLKTYTMSHDEIMHKYGSRMKMVDRIPEALSGAMGNQMYLATFDTEETMNEYYKDLCETVS